MPPDAEALYCKSRMEAMERTVETGSGDAPELKKVMTLLRTEKIDSLYDEIRSHTQEKFAAMDRERKAALEVANVELDLARKKFECDAINAKIKRLQDNIAFIENDWTDVEPAK